jgi:hypothetical protein
MRLDFFTHMMTAGAAGLLLLLLLGAWILDSSIATARTSVHTNELGGVRRDSG